MNETAFANEDERRAAALDAMRGAPPPQGSVGGDSHDVARPDREALELYAEANDLPEYGGVLNPRYLANRAAASDRASQFGNGF